MKTHRYQNWPYRGGADECWVCGDPIRKGSYVYSPFTTDHVNCSQACALQDGEQEADMQAERAKNEMGVSQ